MSRKLIINSKIVREFNNALNDTTGSKYLKKGGSSIFSTKIGGTVSLDKSKWIGNAGTNPNKVRYGFTILDLESIKALNRELTIKSDNKSKKQEFFFLDIAPQQIQQKEIFSTQISATRKGIIVESEGVVFRDIIIQGTTGIFPGKRGSGTTGVDKNTGNSTDPNVTTISGYEEFIRLRQFFLKYAKDKVENDGDKFLVFINEKDNQSLIVEPLEFNMTRDSKSPLMYNYKIVFKGIGDLNTIFSQRTQKEVGLKATLEKKINIVSESKSFIESSRDFLNSNITFLQRISQKIDKTINGPLRQIQFAMEDLNNGITTIASLPEVLIRNTTSTILSIRENIDNIKNTVSNASINNSLKNVAKSLSEREKKIVGLSSFTDNRVETAEERAEASSAFIIQQDIVSKIDNGNRSAITREFIESSKKDLRDVSDNLADFLGMGSSLYNTAKGRTPTLTPDPLKEVSDDEFLLLGVLTNTSEVMNKSLASNVIFKPEADAYFDEVSKRLTSDNIPKDQQISISKPNAVREVRIKTNDTLERIAQREYGNALRWLDLVVLNNLKAPYISTLGGDGVLKPGDKILIGVL